MRPAPGPTEDGADPLPLATAATAVAAVLGLRWAAFAPVTATLAALTFAALAWRWMEAPRSARASGELLAFALCALLALALYLLYAGAARGSILAAPALLATFLGRPRPGGPQVGSP
jgi:cobalamin biosynthesis protein CobD/CbiB